MKNGGFDMDSKYEQLLSAEISLLIPYELLEEYNDFVNPELREVLRANCLRRYLEGAIDLLLKDKIVNTAQIGIDKWNSYNLNNKIQAIGKYYDQDIKTIFDELRQIGNSGSHYGNEVPAEDINKGIGIASKIIEIILVKYFRDYPVGSQPPVMTLLSSLPPQNRVYILEKVWDYGQKDGHVIDKLSMAYLKSGNYNRSISFLKDVYNQGIIDCELYQNFIWKINSLNEHLGEFDIAKNIFDVERIFNYIVTSYDYDRYKEFTNIFLVLISGYRNSD